MFIKYQKVVRDDQGNIQSGSAALMSSTYIAREDGDFKRSHATQSVVERLGKVLWIDPENRNHAIFNSPTRGVVLYEPDTDEFIPVGANDIRLAGTAFENKPLRAHTNFGMSYLFFSELEKSPFMNVLRASFEDDRLLKKALAHLAHDCLKNGSHIKCGEFLSQNCLSYITSGIPVSTLDCDSEYYARLSDDNLKVTYFKNLIAEMRKTNPEFGTCCYVDSTPLPGEAKNNPFNAVSSHGTDGAVIQCRLVLILDIQTSIPVWFEIIPSNVLDKSTIMTISEEIESVLDIRIDEYDLDAGYAREELFARFNRNNSSYVDDDGTIRDHTVLIRMPASNGYPRDEAYIDCKPHFHDVDYEFDYEHHTFFGERREIELFGHPEYAFVFVDKTQAQDLLRNWRVQNVEEWQKLSKSAKEWYEVKDGFFVLTGNRDMSPQEALVEYRGRTKIEGFFKDSKSYLSILPISKWTKETVTGKIFHDIIETTLYREFRKRIAPSELSMSSLLVYLNSWECVRISDDYLEIKTPNLQVREILEKLGYTVPAHVMISAMRKEILEGIPMERIAVKPRKKRNKDIPIPPISPEEKQAAKENAKQEREQKKAEEKARREAEREQKRKEREKAKAKKQEEVKKAGKKENGAQSEAGAGRKKPGVPKGTKRGDFNKKGTPRKKPGPKPKERNVS